MLLKEVDYIVIGAGSAGCVVANRLSADPNQSVLVLEAGKTDRNIWIHVPIGYGKTFFNSTVNWMFHTEPEPGLGGRCIPQPRGRVLGGSSSINGLLYVRGQRQDYDGWSDNGNIGWSYPEVLPFFKRAEDQQRGADAWHGTGGPLPVSDLPEPHVIAEAFIESARHCGVPPNKDFNGASQEGAGYFQGTARRGVRKSTARAYLHPAKHRRNLHVYIGAHVNRIIFEGKKAVGVSFLRNGMTQEIRVRKEVVLCAGAIQSPQILQLSGVGPGKLLNGLGIDLVHDLPGVGESLQDHLQARLIYETHEPITLNDDMMSIVRKVKIGLHYILGRKGPLGWWAGVAGGFARTSPELDRPDVQFHLYPFSTDRKDTPSLHTYSAFTLTVCQLRPYSHGTVHIQSTDPSVPPKITANYLVDPRDMDVMVAGFKLTRKIAQAEPLAGLIKSERSPGREVESEEDIRTFIKTKAMSVYHPVGTCRMGSGADAVVDNQLKVHGLQNLRIADASIMPTLISGNTNAPSIMIGEKAAEMILHERDTSRTPASQIFSQTTA
ncbi:MAG: glucose-methanol-choline oxidoreductase [Polaromonas sp.]|nr:glucose-methanol-choline oxidoreductase [Polaromonas sp.]